MKRRLMIPALLVSALSLALAAGATRQTGITNETKASTIDALLKGLTEEYAYPELAKAADTSIRKHLQSHDYDSVSDGKEFAKLLTQHLNEICKDAHLHVSYSADALPVRKERSAPSQVEIQKEKDWTKYVNAAFKKVERLDGNIGYIAFNNFMDADAARRPIKAAMEFLKDTDALIFDIRQNGGGSPETVKLICSYFFEKPVHLNDLVSREGKHIEWWTTKTVDGSRYTKDVYILVSKRTGSAAEEFSYDLQNLKRATILGEPTWGGANPGGTMRLNDHFTAFVPHMHAENPITKKNWEGTGVIPDIAIDPKIALETAHEMAIRKSLKSTSDGEKKSMLEQILKDMEAKRNTVPPPASAGGGEPSPEQLFSAVESHRLLFV